MKIQNGVLIYEMSAKLTPFVQDFSKSVDNLFNNVLLPFRLNETYYFPTNRFNAQLS